MSETVYYITLAVIFGTALAIAAMKYISDAVQARSRIKGEAAYRDLVEKNAAAQFANAASLATIEAELSQVIRRLGALETILKEVE
jgi:hypothetical protein